MIIIALIVLVVLVLVPDLYIALFMIRDASLVLRLLHWLPLALFLLLAIAAFSGFTKISHQAILTSMFALILFFALPKFFFMLISLLGKLVALAWHPAAAGGNWLGLGVAAVILCAAFYGFVFGWHRLVVHEKEVAFEDLPAAFDGYRIVQLSDLHLGTYHLAPKAVERIVETANELKPDLIVFTGDIVNAHPSEIDMFEGELSKLSAPDGKFSIMGNHDYCEYSGLKQEARAAAVEQVKDKERSVGWDLLLDENRIIRRGTDSLAVVGVQNISKPPFPSYGNLSKALEGLPAGIFKILLSHDPSHWRMGVLPGSDVRLTLSGHTHGAQIRIGKFTPAKFAYPEWGGFFYSTVCADSDESNTENTAVERILHVSTGTGGNVPFRL
ncbi:MAG: metallophosphoesterase, partial [Bacteroidales bacterium]|nr:metallophosphoesterase [Bacteroidales bacterium]